MSISQRRGVITLVPKEDSDLELLNNWRPITFLNLDYNIVSKERYIGQNVRCINDVWNKQNSKISQVFSCNLTFKKPLTPLNGNLSKTLLLFFNYGESIHRWISTFYSNIQSSVLNNGFSTNYFALSRGVRQGCPLSPFLFVLAVELLACKNRQDKI